MIITAVNVETSEAVVFNSVVDAAEYLERDYSTVRRAIVGDRGIKTCAGHVLTTWYNS
jgi:hypothetical protein